MQRMSKQVPWDTSKVSATVMGVSRELIVCKKFNNAVYKYAVWLRKGGVRWHKESLNVFVCRGQKSDAKEKKSEFFGRGHLYKKIKSVD